MNPNPEALSGEQIERLRGYPTIIRDDDSDGLAAAVELHSKGFCALPRWQDGDATIPPGYEVKVPLTTLLWLSTIDSVRAEEREKAAAILRSAKGELEDFASRFKDSHEHELIELLAEIDAYLIRAPQSKGEGA